MIADPVAALVAIALADPNVAAIVGTRGFGGELPADETAHMPRSAFVVRASGGASLTAGSGIAADTIRVDVFSYGPTPKAASDLASVIAFCFRQAPRQVAAATLVHWIKPAGGWSSAREPDAEWPRAFQSFQVFHALESIP
jgi:hypothetical protein